MRLSALLLACMLAACGGGEDEPTRYPDCTDAQIPYWWAANYRGADASAEVGCTPKEKQP